MLHNCLLLTINALQINFSEFFNAMTSQKDITNEPELETLLEVEPSALQPSIDVSEENTAPLDLPWRNSTM